MSTGRERMKKTLKLQERDRTIGGTKPWQPQAKAECRIQAEKL